ncbi:MAG: Na/Pi cotransporter family protein [Clostridia bacterium]|nr:Na/Pi cotransporter family protein [Clostridia bacterium]
MELSDIFTLLGGIALFLFGMHLMGDGLKRVAGNKLELILFRLTSTPLKGMLLGTGVTAVIQSSSATSVMVVGFVNSGMMKLRQAIAVIMGAIIGTSITGWVISLSEIGGAGSAAISLLSTETLAGVVAVAGILIQMLSKKQSWKHIGDILMGFAILMFGMRIMSSAVSGLKEEPLFLNAMSNISNPFLGILIGIAVTAILQSASASVGILQALSSTGAITFDTVLPLILGIAIGASVPVLISAIGSSGEGKRTAFSYLYVEVLRVILFAAVFYTLNAFLHFAFMQKTMDMVSIALLNTMFRIVTVAVLAPFIPLIEKAVVKIIPAQSEDSEETADMERLEERFLAYPSLAVEQSRMAIETMARLTMRDLNLGMSLLMNFSEAGYRETEKLEGIVDRYEDKIGTYLMRLTGRELTDEQNKAVSQYLRALTDLERISDHALKIAKSAQEMEEKEIIFTDKGIRELNNLMNAVREISEITLQSFIDNNAETACRIEPLEQVIDRLCQDMRAKHTERLRSGECSISHGYVFNDLISEFGRVSDHCSNMGIVIVELPQNTLDTHAVSNEIKYNHANGFSAFYSEYGRKYLEQDS